MGGRKKEGFDEKGWILYTMDGVGAERGLGANGGIGLWHGLR